MNETFIGAGLTLIINENNNYSILMAKSNSKKEYKKNVWLFPGGRRNNTELPYQTAYREFIEEIFNVVVSDFIVNEIIDNISKDENLYPINTRISENSFTFIQSVDAITHFVNVLNSNNIKSDVFPFGYDNLYDIDKKYEEIIHDKPRAVVISSFFPNFGEDANACDTSAIPNAIQFNMMS